MTDCVHLYVFDCQNFVSEKDYRAVLEQRRGFENAALDNETAAKKAKLELELAYDEMRNLYIDIDKAKAEVERWKKKAELHAFEIQKRIVNAHGQGYEAGRREGLEGFAQRAEGFTAPWYSPEEIAAIVRIYVEDMQRKALIDSPKAEGEKPPKMLYVAFDCLGNPYAVSTRPEHIACDPARIKPYVPVEAEGEETK